MTRKRLSRLARNPEERAMMKRVHAAPKGQKTVRYREFVKWQMQQLREGK